MSFRNRRVVAFSKRERQALIALIAILVAVEGLGYFSPYFFAPQRRDFQHRVIYDTVVVYEQSAEGDNRPVRDRSKKSEGFRSSESHARLKNSNEFKSMPKKFTIQLNETDTLAWEALPGIGPTFSRRILKYRALLGGYERKEQLSEVYGLDTSGAWYSRVLEDDVLLDSLKLNSDSIQRLWRHPYVSPSMASEWVRYRERAGKFNSLDQVRQGYLMTDSIFRKLVPYLSLQ